MGKTTKSKGFNTMLDNKVTWVTVERIILRLDKVNQDLDKIRLNLNELNSKEFDKNREEIYQGLIEIKETFEKF